jgi:hypothetical protein
MCLRNEGGFEKTWKKKHYLGLRFIKALYNFNFCPTFVVLVTLNARSNYSNVLKSGLLVRWRTSSLAQQLFRHPKSLHVILICTQRDATLHSLFYLENAVRVSGGTITHHQEHKQLYLQHLLFVTPLLLSATAYATHNTLKPFPTLPR